MNGISVVLVTFWGGWIVASLLFHLVRWLRRPRYDDELVLTFGPYEAAPRPGDIVPPGDPKTGPSLHYHRVTRVTGCVHRAGECHGWRAIYGVRVK